MKKINIILVLLSLSFTVLASYNSNGLNNIVKKTNLSDCTPSTSQVDLDINNVRVRMLGAGDMWWDKEAAKYEYPKIDQTSGAISKNVFFLGALWFTGEDDGGSLRCAAQRYEGNDFWTGPLENFGIVSSETCNAFDKHFVVYGSEIVEFLATYAENGFVIGEADIPDNIKYWPGKGNPILLNSSVEEHNSWYYNEGSLAPFFDNDGDGIYNPVNGDYPVIKVSESSTGQLQGNYADQMIFWVLNDEGNTHTNSNGTEIGVQINCLAFAFQTSDELNDMTFYTFEIFKKTSGNLNQTYMSVCTDPDVGAYDDDYIGCDIERSVAYCFNGDAYDDEYGSTPPLVGIDFFEGPLADDSSELGMSSFMYYNNANGPQGDPSEAQEYRNYQLGLWADGSPLTIGGDGTNPVSATNSITQYAYPGNPGTLEYWSECNNDGTGTRNAAADRRFIQTSGPFTLNTSQSQRISIGVMITEIDPATFNNGCPNFEILMGSANNKAQFIFDNNFGIVDGPDAPNLKIRELENELVINLINDKSSNNFAENYSVEAAGSNSLFTNDTSYRFEGYKVYQLKNANITAKDLSNQAKAKLVYQSDIKNDINTIFNYELDITSGQYLPTVMVESENNGIVKTLNVKEDLFLGGELVNYQPYFYAVVAYAYNNHTQFDPLDINKGTSQLEQYLQGRRNFKVYSAIPHNVTSENNGTVLNSVYGQGLVVKRYEGQGNGGRHIELSKETVQDIIYNHSKDILTYRPLFDPLGLKIIDPMAVQDVDFELRILDETNTVTKNSTWELNISKDGVFVETIASDRPMDRPYDQIIEDYGIVVNVGSPLAVNTNLRNGAGVYDFLSSDIRYKDETSKWLSFVTNAINGPMSPSNWIRSGTFRDFNLLTKNIYDSHQYDELTGSANNAFYDENEVFANILNSGFAPYCLTTNYLRPKNTVETDLNGDNETIKATYSTFGPAFLWDKFAALNTADSIMNPQNTLDKLVSIDIVMTSDKSKWTRCLVFETAENAIESVGNARKGQLRAAESLDKDGLEILGDQGRSYFPGYAINLENGERLNMAFGENSYRGDNNGDDMIWNPTSKLYDNSTMIDGTDYLTPVYGGKHFIYVFDTKYDEGLEAKLLLDINYPSGSSPAYIPVEVQDIYNQIIYTAIPYVSEDYKLLDISDGLIPNDDTIKIRVEKPYSPYYTEETDAVETNDSMPRYGFSTVGLAPQTDIDSLATSALDNIRVVPNPYYGFSSYEQHQNASLVKITNLPDVCTISIYTMDGKLVKRLERTFGDEGNEASTKQDLSLGQEFGVFNFDNSQTWNLKNEKDIPVASGTYIIHVNAPNVGEKIVKSVVFVRNPDISNF